MPTGGPVWGNSCAYPVWTTAAATTVDYNVTYNQPQPYVMVPVEPASPPGPTEPETNLAWLRAQVTEITEYALAA